MIPNILTAIRIAVSLTLLPFNPVSYYFQFLYIIAGISDLLDGYIARMTQTETELGARLDSLADLIFCIIVLYKVLPVIHIYKYVPVFFILIVIIRMIAVLVCRVKFGKVAMLHTISNKMTGILLFFYLFFATSNVSAIYQYGLCCLGMISAVEELWIHIRSEEWELNRASIWKSRRSL
ncbi:MAG: CDP-alcohol phosphatidyltransferase family protein [Clostridia bacterium]|nr:CDP-alcohol phosphatidyltransferase family protein [Clostridia bacterium]